MFQTDLFFLGIIALSTAILLREVYLLCRQCRLTPFMSFGMVMGIALMFLRWLSLPLTPHILSGMSGLKDFPAWISELMRWGFMLGLVTAVFGALWLQATKRDNAGTFESISTTLFGLLYVIFLSGFLIDIRRLGQDGVLGGIEWESTGALFVFATISITKLCDVGAFAFGNWFGRHKMIPRISPKKTYEGALGGVIFSVLSAIYFYFMNLFPLPGVIHVIIFAVIIAVVGMYGDLAESLLKRASGMKDSGKLVPGFGGALDVADSVLISAPVAYVLLVIMLGL